MRYYPIFLDLSGRTCLVVGAGSVVCRKIASLLACDPARIKVLDPAAPGETLQALLEDSRIVYEQRPFMPADVEGCTLVFAATSDRGTNAAVADACTERGSPAIAPTPRRKVPLSYPRISNKETSPSRFPPAEEARHSPARCVGNWKAGSTGGSRRSANFWRGSAPWFLPCNKRRGRIQPSSGTSWNHRWPTRCGAGIGVPARHC